MCADSRCPSYALYPYIADANTKNIAQEYILISTPIYWFTGIIAMNKIKTVETTFVKGLDVKNRTNSILAITPRLENILIATNESPNMEQKLFNMK
jgi:hypothetical protein